MGRGGARKVEKGVLGGSSDGGLAGSCSSLNLPTGPVFYPSEEEFKDPLEYIEKIRPQAEPYGICKIVPPTGWKPPFALDLDSLTFPTKLQAIHQLQARVAPCDSKTFTLEYNRFLEEHCGKNVKKRVVFEGEDLNFCKLFNAVKRFGGYDSVVKSKKWGEVFRYVRPGGKITECSKHVLSQLYLEHLLDYEEYYCRLNKVKSKSCKRGVSGRSKVKPEITGPSVKRRRKTKECDRVEACEVGKGELDQICEQCSSGLHGEVMLLCDRCDKGWHIYCLSPPLKIIPSGNWYCFECVNSEKESFGFVPGKQISLGTFRRVADRVKKKWFGSSATSFEQLEKKFWKIVEGSVGEVEVMYGSDLDTSVYGSGFPRQADQSPPSVDGDAWNEYCKSPWNLNNLPRLQGSMLQSVHQNIAGVMVPWLYVGMLFSSFCWHFEDHCFYSMNYLHWGEPKCWYSVPGNEAMAFEKVMQGCLPDLFEAQPDLLFQLITMLSPSVLQAKGVPVYNVIQEPGNFVVTFPRSYHGGFNLGLNCAEAVNFAPADWLPHGGIGAELYRQYHRLPVLSHEELLCVVAKNELDNRISTYLKGELLRLYNNEKAGRERLWRNGIIRSSPMPPRLNPDYIASEEDPVCVICQQLLYLSAVSCRCRPSAYVCILHWHHLCECKPNNLCLLYRYTLAELTGLVRRVNKCDFLEETGDSRRITCPGKVAALGKKVNGSYTTHLQLAEEWISNAKKILELPYSKHSYVSALEEAEQFLWGGCEMDLVREMEINLIRAQTWAEAVKVCLSQVTQWSSNHGICTERVPMSHIDELLRNAPCCEPSYLQLKEYHEEANKVIEEINSVLTLCSKSSVADLEILYLKAVNLPIHTRECEKLEHKLSAIKILVDKVRKCTSQISPSSVDVDMVYKLELELEILERQLQLPEADLLEKLAQQAKSCMFRCNEILKDPIHLKEVEVFVHEWRDFTVCIPELELLKQYYSDTTSWISHVNLVLMNIHEREDQENVVDELISIQKDGLSLKIQVDELPLVEVELQKARCRAKASKALQNKISMEFMQQLMSEAETLHIDQEKGFAGIYQMHADAMCWEVEAKHVLAARGSMPDFENVLRVSERIGIIPPSCVEIKHAVSTAKAWLIRAKPFLCQDSSTLPGSDSCLRVEVLKDLILESEELKVYMEEHLLLEELLKEGIQWEQDAYLLLLDAEKLWNIDITGEVVTRLEGLVLSMEAAKSSGISLGLDFSLVSKLQDACSTFNWCIKTLSFSINCPTRKEVEMMWDAAGFLPSRYRSCASWSVMTSCLSWLRKSLEVLDPENYGQFELSFVEEHLLLSKNICISFPLIIGCLQEVVQNHNLWLEQVNLFFGLNIEDRSWNTLLHLKELGSSQALSCVELERVLVEFERAQRWKENCIDITKPPEAVESALLTVLLELKNSAELSLEVYKCINGEPRNLCMCCSSPIQGHDVLTCSLCKDSFHLQCSRTSSQDTSQFVCCYCNFLNSSKPPYSVSCSLRTGRKHIELDKLSVLSFDANDLCVWAEEKSLLYQIVDAMHACSGFLMEFGNFTLSYMGKDLNVVARKLCIALKAMDIAGICDVEGSRIFVLALTRVFWRSRAESLLESAEKPKIQQIQHHLKEGLRINVPLEDYFILKLTQVRDIALEWADRARKVSVDGGILELDKVFQLISEGESLRVSCGQELKLLRDRSMLYCICRKPYNRRPMIACDECDEWYHFDCINISSAPKIYICPACNFYPTGDACLSETTSGERFPDNFEEPQTPLRQCELRQNLHRPKVVSKKTPLEMDINDCLKNFSSRDGLCWRNKKPFRRAARKRSEFQSLYRISEEYR